MKCYKQYGSPGIENDRVTEAERLIAEVYGYSDLGGNLHIVIDDWNLDDGSIDFCLKEIEKDRQKDESEFDPWYGKPSKEQFDAEEKCARFLRKLSLKERASALARHDGFLVKQ